MSLQTYDINLTLNATQDTGAQGRYIYYLSGTTPNITGGVSAAAGNQAIKVQPGNTGATIILMPGQSLRLPADDKAPSSWKVSNYKNAEVITGMVMIGEGEFHDSNTSNTIKLDASFANKVEVTNDTSKRVPVAIDPNALINQAAPVMTYTAFKTAIAVTATSYNTPAITAAENVNGVIIESTRANSQILSLFAKATVPVGIADPTAALLNTVQAAAIDRTRIKVPAGQAIWLINTTAGAATADITYTVL